MTKLEKAIKELRWLQFNFPWQDNPENDADKMFNAIHKYAGDAIELLESQQWVSVKDRLPEKEGHYLCWACINNIQYLYQICLWKENRWYWVHDVRWWMPLPESPKEETENVD